MLSTLGLAVVLGLTATVNAQQPAAKPGEPVSVPAYRAKQVLGTNVFLAGNVGVGTIDDIVFDDMGQIEYVIVNKDDKLVTIPWEAAKFNFEKRTATLSIPQEKYTAIPTYSVQQYPTFYAPTYRTTTYRYFGLTPRERRIIERRP